MRYVLKRLFGEEFKELLLLNLMTAALCLPLVTAGPALLALTGTMIKILDNHCNLSRVKEFWGLFKEKFWSGVLMEVCVGAYAALLAWCISLTQAVQRGSGILLAAVMLAGFLAAIISVCLAAVLAGTELKFGEALWNAACLALGRLPRAMLAAVFFYGLGYAAVLLYPISVLLYVTVMISCTQILTIAALWPALDELVLHTSDNKMLDERDEKH